MPRLGTYLDLTADKLREGQDPKALVMAFFGYPERIRIQKVTVYGKEYRAGYVVAQHPEVFGAEQRELDALQGKGAAA